MSLDLTISQAVIVPLLDRAASCAAVKSPMPILTCTVLDAVGGTLTMRATNNVVGMQAAVDAKVKVPGSTAVDSAKLAATVRGMPAGDIRLQVKDAKLIVSAGKSRFALATLDPADFPALPDVAQAGEIVTLPARELALALARGGYAAASTDDRPLLIASLLDIGNGTLRVVSTDGNRMAVARAGLDGVSKEYSLAIPTKCVGELRKLCDLAKDGNVSLAATHADLFARAGGVTLICKTSATDMLKSWPRLLSHCEATAVNAVTLSQSGLLSALKRVNAVVGPGVVLRLDFAPGTCRVSADSGTNDGADEVECDASAEFSWACNPALLADALSVVLDDEVTLRVGGNMDALLVTGAASNDTTGVVMPMRAS